MKKCAYLSMNDLSDFECYDHLTVQPLNALGWDVKEVSWRDTTIDWNRYDLVVVRSPWDYQDDYLAFISVLAKIERSSAKLANPFSLMKWNVDKHYLQDIQESGVSIVPTHWHSSYAKNLLSDAAEVFNTQELIMKPCVSANADDTFRLNLASSKIDHSALSRLFTDRDFMVQPFIKSIIEEGEFSLFFFNNQYSHAILKVPKTDDFRVQEEHGGRLYKIEPEEELLEIATKTLSVLPDKTLYARLDFVRSNHHFLLMEAELIEPSLYFNLDPDSPVHFANALDNYWNKIN